MEHLGKTLVMTNGCFDLLHVGHVRYLRKAKALGSVLLVLLNSDQSVRQLKGRYRPVNGQRDRAEIIGALECVDAVYIFGDKRITKWLARLKPNVWAKGGDYTIHSLDQDEVAAAGANGTRIEIIPAQRKLSTTKLIAIANRL